MAAMAHRLAVAALLTAAAYGMDLRNAAIVSPADAAGPEKKAAQMLSDEIDEHVRMLLRDSRWAGESACPTN
jgi:hypothetical protein